MRKIAGIDVVTAQGVKQFVSNEHVEIVIKTYYVDDKLCGYYAVVDKKTGTVNTEIHLTENIIVYYEGI